ncbi:MAG: transporter substrate-binding domain-containing protein [Thermodesulfovibrionales bacterium]
MRFAILIVVFTSIILGPCCVLAQETIKVGVYDNAPKIFMSKSGRAEGIFIDIIEYIAKKEGWRIQYLYCTWSEGLDKLSKGEIDIMPDVAYTSDRSKLFEFHNTPVLSSWFQVFARKGIGIKSLLDLDGKRVVVLENSVQQQAFIRMTEGFHLDVSLITEKEYDKVFEVVAKGKADAAIANHFYGTLHARSFGLEDTAVVFHPSSLFFAFHKNINRDIIHKVERHIRVLKRDPESIYYSSLKRWTSHEVRYKLPDWLPIAGAVVAALLFVSLAGGLVLRHQVDVKTRQLRQINQEMELRVMERTLELTKANEKLKELDMLKSMFIASMSHELRTPLNSIIGFTGITLQGLSGELNEEQKDNLKRVYNSAKHLLNLITEIIDISKIEAGRIDILPEHFPLISVINEAVDNITQQAKDKGLLVEIDVPNDTVDTTMLTDKKRLFQCLLNLHLRLVIEISVTDLKYL